MNKIRGSVILAAVVAGGLLVFIAVKSRKPGKQTTAMTNTPALSASAATDNPSPTPVSPKRRGIAVRKADMTPEELAQLETIYKEKFKPAISKWSQAYAGRISFSPDDVTFDKFHSRLGTNPGHYNYTFMIDGTTFSISEYEGQYAVGYLSTPAAPKLMSVQGGQTPILTVPVTKQEVIQMVKAAIGEEFPPDEITIKPTGLACDVNGGAFVKVSPLYSKDNEVGVVNMVIGPDGKLITYDCTPFKEIYQPKPLTQKAR